MHTTVLPGEARDHGAMAAVGEGGLAYRSFEVCTPRDWNRQDDGVSMVVIPQGGASSQFQVSLPHTTDVRIAAFDLAGCGVATISECRWDAGMRAVS